MTDRSIRRHARVAALVLMVGGLGGCQFWIAGHSKDYGLVLSGEGVANIGDGTTTFQLQADGKNIKCEGKSTPSHRTPNHIGSRAAVEIVCDDGRKATGESVLTSMEGGTGTGTDSCGNEVELLFHINHGRVQKALESYRQTRKSSPAGVDRCDAASGDAPPHRDPLS